MRILRAKSLFAAQHQLAKRASSKDKTLKMYDGSYHELLTDTTKAQVWKDVIEWIDARI
ncbi:MAG: serine aminopeptidase domain-containing protein [Anaerolineales bacterium]